jgi:UPF0716 protein FxsA
VTSFRSRLLIFGYPILELVTIYLVAQAIGWGWTFLLLLAGIPVGFAVMRNAGDAAMQDVVAASQTGTPVDAGRHSLSFVGGLLIAIPGFWTDLLGLLLVIPPTQRLFRARTRSWFSQRFTTVRVPGVHNPGGDVIQGDVISSTVHRDDEAGPPSPGSPPQIER